MDTSLYRPERFLLQVEFFFTRGRTLEAVMEDIADRVLDGSPLKRSIRFYDVEGRLTQKVLAWGRSRRLGHPTFIRSRTVGQKRKRKLERLHRRLTARDQEFETSVPACILDCLTGCILRGEDIALEDFGGQGFRIVAPNERAELMAMLPRARKQPWIFVFRDADLLADNLSIVGSVM